MTVSPTASHARRTSLRVLSRGRLFRFDPTFALHQLLRNGFGPRTCVDSPGRFRQLASSGTCGGHGLCGRAYLTMSPVLGVAGQAQKFQFVRALIARTPEAVGSLLGAQV